MNRKKYIAIVTLALLLAGTFLFAVNQKAQVNTRIFSRSFNGNPVVKNQKWKVMPAVGSHPADAKDLEKKPATQAEKYNSESLYNLGSADIPVILSIGSSTYSLEVPRDTTVYDAMSILASSSENFNFKSKYFPGLGYFIEQINEVRNAGGHYWTLYINGKYSNAGASQYKPAGGDKIEWRYEKK